MLTRALSWSMLSAVIGIVMQIGLMAVLGRLLGPVEFGLMASAALAMRFVSYFAQFGLGPALIQRSKVEPGHEAAAFASALGIGLVCWLIFLLLAVPFANFFRDDKLRTILMVTPASMLLGALASVPQSMLRRNLRFKALALTDLASLVFGYGAVAIVLTMLGLGVWSLVFAGIVQQLFSLVGSAWLARSRPFATTERRHYADMFAYGAKYSVNGFLDFISSNVETIFTGRVLGVDKLGVYNRAQTVTALPVEQFVGAASRVMFPAFSAMRESRDKLREGVLLSIHLSTVLTLPIACGMSVAAGNLVIVTLGAKWSDAVLVAQILAWGIPAAHISVFSGNAVDSLALFRNKGLIIIGITVLKLVLIGGGAYFGLAGIAAATVFSEWMRALALSALVCPHFGASVKDVIFRLRHGAAVAVSVGLAVALASLTLKAVDADIARGPVLVAQILFGAMAFLSTAWLSLRRLLGLYSGSLIDLGVLRRIARLRPEPGLSTS